MTKIDLTQLEPGHSTVVVKRRTLDGNTEFERRLVTRVTEDRLIVQGGDAFDAYGRPLSQTQAGREASREGLDSPNS